MNDVDIAYISVGDIVVIGTLDTDITGESDLTDYYKIMSVKNDNFGRTPHIHIGAK